MLTIWITAIVFCLINIILDPIFAARTGSRSQQESVQLTRIKCLWIIAFAVILSINGSLCK